MTDSAVAARRVAALTLIPASVAVFGAGLAWATNHDPSTSSTPESVPAPTTDPQLALAEAKVDDARARLAQLQDEVNRRNAERVALQEQQAAGVVPPAAQAPAAAAPAAAAPKAQTGTTTKKTTVTQPVVAAAPAAPAVQTVTKASTKK